MKKADDVPCSYGCGRVAAGTLSVTWIPYAGSAKQRSDYNRDRSITAYVPACRECVASNVQITIQIPSSKEKRP